MNQSASSEKIRVGLVQINNSFSGQNYLPLSVGVLQAYAQAYASNKDRLEFMVPVFCRDPVAESAEKLEQADIVGFSIYVWNMNISLQIARKLKRKNPEILILFGGPQVPDAAEAFLREHPFIDIVCHGEGEQVFLEILEHIETRDWCGIQAVSFLKPDGFFENHARVSRITDLSAIPSPFLSGTFQRLMATRKEGQWLGLWETNRGCPFSCAFCEWGAETLNRVYRFDMERLTEEARWFAEKKIEFIFCCDANFGILERDIEITECMVKMNGKFGYPHAFSVQSTKNATERIYRIQKLLNDSNLSKGVLLALQSVHPPTLEKIQRANISLDTFGELQRRFKRAGIKTFTDLILGLPGETYDTFADGVSKIIDSGQHDRIQFINLSILGNARMGDPEFQKLYGMETVRSRIVNIHGSLEGFEDEIQEVQELVIATKDMPREEWARTRVFSWVMALLHFNKLFQVPMILLHDGGGISYREMVEVFTEGDLEQLPILSEIRSFFDGKARDIQNGGPEFCNDEKWLNIWWPPDEYMMVEICAEGKLEKFYGEAERLMRRFLRDKSVDFQQGLLRAAVELNAKLIKLPFQTEDIDITVPFNVWEFYQSVLEGDSVPLEERECTYRIDRRSETWTSWNDWCRKVVWWGNKKGLYMYGVKTVGE